MELNTLQQTVTENINSSNAAVADKVVNYFVEIEVDRRVNSLTKSIQELEKLDKDLLKVKPDQKSYSAEGMVVAETFSQAKIDERKKLQEKINKLRKAIEKALNENQFGDLFNLTNAQKSEDPKTEAK